MPAKVKVKIISGKNLPIMDRSNDTTDAYVEIRLGNTTYKTDVCRRSLNPHWNTDWYRFEVDDSELQDEPLQIRLMDHDLYSANDAIGKVYLNLNPLIIPAVGQLAIGDNNPQHEISGWIPVYDTMHGIRGEVNVTVKVELFSDFNRFRQSSCGVQFFYSPTIPQGFQAKVINGFVEELVVDDDPEYQWIDKIRTPRASNEARQTLFFKLSGELQRKIGVKALGLGGNAVIGYKQCFDLEGESGIVARGIGTVVTLIKSFTVPHVCLEPKEEEIENYLKFVGDGKSFSLLCSTSPSLPQKYQYSLSLLELMTHTTNNPLIVDPIIICSSTPSKLLTKRLYASVDSSNNNIINTQIIAPSSKSNPNLFNDPNNKHYKVLLNQEEKRGKSAITRKFEKFKHSQKSLSKKMYALKAKINDSIGEEETVDDDTTTGGVKIVDKRKFFKRTSSDSSAMAEILARSVMRATTSLSCILEDQPNTSSQLLEIVEDDTMEKLKPIQNILNQTESEQLSDGGEDEEEEEEINSEALSCSNSDSNSTSSNSYEYTDYNNKVNSDVETISNIITNVEKLQRCLSGDNLKKQYSLPSIPTTRRYSFNSIIDNFDSSMPTTSSFSVIPSHDPIVEESPRIYEERRASDAYDARIFKTNKKLLERSEEIDLPDPVWPSTSSSSVEHIQSIKTEHELNYPPQVKSSKSSSDTMFNSALKTMLFERANILGTPSTPAAATAIDDSEKKFEFPHHHHHHRESTEPVESKGIIKTALETMLFERADLVGTPSVESTVEQFPEDNDVNSSIASANLDNVDVQPKKMVKTAMQTMLLDKFNLLGTYTPPSSPILNSSDSSSQGRQRSFTFSEPTIIRKETISKCDSFTSLVEDQKKEKIDTVLGMSFISLTSLKESSGNNNTDNVQNPKELVKKSFLSDSNLPQSSETLKKKASSSSSSSVRKKFFNFLHYHHSKTPEFIKRETGSSSVFHKFRRSSKKSLSDDYLDNKESIFARMFHTSTTSPSSSARHEEKSMMMMMMMKNEETQTTSNNNTDEIISSSPSIIIINKNPSSNTNLIKNLSPNKAPEDLALGDFIAHSKTKSACITTTTSHHQSLQPAEERIIAQQNQQPGKAAAAAAATAEESAEGKIEPSGGKKISHSPIKVNMIPLHRRSSDSDLSITPKGNSLTGSDKSVGATGAYFMRNNYTRRGQLTQEHLDLLEYPFLTMTKFPIKFITKLGGSVSARSVKLYERISNGDESESRDTWWSEIRMEIRSHARSLNCNAILGYTELTSICDDVCILNACGTAAVIDYNCTTSGDEDNNAANVHLIHKNLERGGGDKQHHIISHRIAASSSSNDSPDHRNYLCNVTHLPYDDKSVPIKAKVSKCPMCRKGKVPDVLIATIEPPDLIPITGKGCFIESHISRPLKELRGEAIAKEISEGLPFLEYELYRLLLNKLKIRGMNTIFSLKIRITVGEKMLVGVATGTAMYLLCLPSPDIPMLVTSRVSDEKLVAELQEMLGVTVQKNKDLYQIKNDVIPQFGSNDGSDEEQGPLDISSGNKDCCILEMDDPEDAEVLKLLIQEEVPDGFHVVSTESVPGLEELEVVKNLQMFTQIYRAKVSPPYNLQKNFVRILQSIYFKLRRMVPCALCDLQYRIDIPEADEIQICVIGMALGLGKKVKDKIIAALPKKTTDDDLMFKLDEEYPTEPVAAIKPSQSSIRFRAHHRSPSKHIINRTHHQSSIKHRLVPASGRHGVDITPLSYVPGGNIEQYLGNLNFFFIRETTSIREEGGLSGFIHSFVTEVLAIVRSHVTALGGNALVAFFMTQCVLNHNLHKNQGQCLINVGGDVVSVSYNKV